MPLPEAATIDIDYVVAEAEHLDALGELFKAFFEESQLGLLGLGVDEERGRRWLAKAIDIRNPEYILAIDRETGLLVGVLGWVKDWAWTAQPFAVLDKFYVRNGWRTRRIGATLLMLAEDLVRSEGCVAFMACISSGIGNSKRLFLDNSYAEVPGSALMAKRL